MKTYLYKKTHRKTGLKYLGKTKNQDPFAYPGSGIYWTSHLKIHGDDCDTEILKECDSDQEIKEWGLHYSRLWDIVESEEWANLKEECGDGGDTSMTPNYKKYQAMITEIKSKCRWWNNGINQVHSEVPPDDTYSSGRLPFNNVGAQAGAAVQSEKVWITDGSTEMMVHRMSPIPDSFRLGRMNPFPGFVSGSHVKGSTWWNNGTISKMSKSSPGPEWNKGRLPFSRTKK
jgi:hypothetical protein